MLFKIKKPKRRQSLIEPLVSYGAADARAAHRGPRFALRRLLEAHFVIPLCAAVLLVSAWTVVFHLVRMEGAVAQSAASELSRELADTYEAQMARNLVTIDQTLKTIKYAYEMKNGVSLAQLREHGLLPSATVFDVAVVDSSGRIETATRPHSITTVETQPYFSTQRERSEDGTAPFVSQVMRTGRYSTPEITFTRRLRNAQGKFAGIVMLSVDPGYVTGTYDSARMGKQGLLALLGTDGIVRSEQTGENTSWGRRLSAAVVSAAEQDKSESVAVYPWDRGVHRYTNVRTLRGFSLIAIVGLGQGEQLAQFRKHRRVYFIWTFLGSIALILLAFVLSRSSRQLTDSRRHARLSQQMYYTVSEASIDAFFLFRSERSEDGEIRDFVMLDTNRRGTEILGLSLEHLLGQSLAAVLPLARANGMFDEFVSVARTGDVREREWSHERTDGTTVWLHRQVLPVEHGVVAIVRDITLIKRADLRRVEYNRVLEMVATSTPLEEVLSYMARVLESQIPGTLCAALLCDEHGHTLKLGAAPSLPQQYRDRMNGLSIGPDTGPSGRAAHSRQPVFIAELALDEQFRSEMRSYGLKDVHGCWALPILSHDGSSLGALTLYVCEARDPMEDEALALAMATRLCGIAIERTITEERIRHMSNHDALTGLPTRRLLSDRLKQVLLHAQRYQRGVTVIFIDLDNFKLINDSLGHRSGDELLKTVASRMLESARRTDTVVRLGGNEFVLVLFEEDQSGDTIATAVEKIRNVVLRPLQLNGQTYQVTCSMGVASYPDEGSDADTLLLNADAAMCRAKEMGGNNYQIYTGEMNVKMHDKLRLQEDLRKALANEEFQLAYQPQVDLHTQQVFGVEALLRWHHPFDGLISPATFIPIAEDTGLILSIGDWVMHAACRQNKAWHEQGMPHITMAVNVSARQFLQKDLVARVAHALTESRLEPQYLELEITESVIMQDLEGAVATMDQLQGMGVKLSVDDFGTGYSSLSALKHFPIARLKIDQSFVRELPGGQDDRAIAMAVISLGRQLNLRVLAEGVETAQQLAFLRENGCNEIQGYHYSRPLYPAELEELLNRPFAWPTTIAPRGQP